MAPGEVRWNRIAKERSYGCGGRSILIAGKTSGVPEGTYRECNYAEHDKISNGAAFSAPLCEALFVVLLENWREGSLFVHRFENSS
jgi:hypothetical protein